MMQSIDTLFNNTPGCVLATGSVPTSQGSALQQLNFACVTADGVGSDGTSILEQIPSNQTGATAYLDNPINDVAVSDAPIGSSNGIQQLEQGRNNGTTGIGKSNTTEDYSAVNFARSSRIQSGSKDIQGLNFVAYATDGVSWVHWTKTSGSTASNSAKVTSLTSTQLLEIYDGTIYNWAQVGGKNAPIDVFAAQEGSGTQSTFKTFLGGQSGAPSGFDPSAQTNTVNCTVLPAPSGKGINTVYPAGPGTSCAGPNVIFENELTSVPAADQANAIFFYSFGKFAEQCESVKTKIEQFDGTTNAAQTVNQKKGSDCGGSTSVGGKVGIGAVAPVTAGTTGNSVAPNPSTILSGQFPITRDLYNVYSNGFNPNIAPATAATLNYVSEVGFACKPQTVDGTANTAAANEIVDPATGTWYQTEIANAIEAAGFIPIDATASGTGYGDIVAPTAPIAEGSVTHTAYNLLSGATDPSGSTTPVTLAGASTYLDTAAPGQSTNTSIPTTSNPLGFCQVSTTDGGSNE